MDTPLKIAFDKVDSVPAQSRVEVVRGVQLRRKKSGQSILTIHYSAVPERDPNTPEGARWLKRERATYSSKAQWDREQEIDANAGGGENVFGAILSEHYEKVIISDPHWHPRPDWDVAGGFDHGKTNATALLKAYISRAEIDPVTGKERPPDLYLCGEYYSMRRNGWSNNVGDNVREMLRMPDLERMRWIAADPAIFAETQAKSEGDYEAVYKEYRKAGFVKMRPYSGIRTDVTFVEWMLSDYWGFIEKGRRPRCYIVCRNPSDRPQPGLHPYDCPNLVWELKRAKRVEMTARQLLTRNQSEAIVDKDNHARDAFKYITGTVKTAAQVPLHEEMEEKLEGLDPTSRQIAARHLFSEAVRKGQIDWTGKPKRSAPVISLRGRRR